MKGKQKRRKKGVEKSKEKENNGKEAKQNILAFRFFLIHTFLFSQKIKEDSPDKEKSVNKFEQDIKQGFCEISDENGLIMISHIGELS